MSEAAFHYEPAADHPGWFTWNLADQTLFNAQTMGDLLTRVEEGADGIRRARLRMFPQRRHANVLGGVHGAVTLALIDISLFSAMHTLIGSNAASSVTLDLSTQFIGAGKVGEPLDAVVEVLRETGRLVFLRGLVEQGETTVAAFNGTIRKPSAR